MSDYIERQKVKDIRFSSGINHDGFLYVPYKELVDGIKALPPADVVQVVRCDDCKYYGSRRWCELHSSVFDDNAFCSYGERKE